MDIFTLTLILNFSAVIAAFSGIAIVASIFGAVTSGKWWIAIILAFALSVGLYRASSKSLENISPKVLEKAMGYE